MDPRKLFVDERHAYYCVYCGAVPDTQEHVPSRVFLDEPLPKNLPVVRSCFACNNGFSADELYVAVALECAARGTANTDQLARAKIARKLIEAPALARNISLAFTLPDACGTRSLQLEEERVANIVLKLARGHIAYEHGEPVFAKPRSLWFQRLGKLGQEFRRDFEIPPAQRLWPEIGSRAFLKALRTDVPSVNDGWETVQANRYRYLVSGEPCCVRLVIGEYLGAEVVWD